MTKNMEDNESDFVDNNVAVNVNKGIGINYQINVIVYNRLKFNSYGKKGKRFKKSFKSRRKFEILQHLEF